MPPNIALILSKLRVEEREQEKKPFAATGFALSCVSAALIYFNYIVQVSFFPNALDQDKIILERTTGMSISEYLEARIGKAMGMEFPASWSLDSRKSGFEISSAGINARAVDFARFGRLFLNRGNWEGRQILSKRWVEMSTRPPDIRGSREDYYRYVEGPKILRSFFAESGGCYGMAWWGYELENGEYDYFGSGALGQFLYVSPRHRAIVVRHGTGWGGMIWWPEIFRNMLDALQ